MSKTLAKAIQARMEEFASFPEELRVRAENNRLRTLLNEISKESEIPFEGSKEEAEEKLSNIFLMIDNFPDVDIEEDIAFMKAEQEKDKASQN